MPSNDQSNTAGQVDTTPTPTVVRPSHCEFVERIREQARQGLRLLLEQTMQEELTALVGAKWGEHTAARQGYRNGYYQRDLLTNTGPLAKLHCNRPQPRCMWPEPVSAKSVKWSKL